MTVKGMNNVTHVTNVTFAIHFSHQIRVVIIRIVVLNHKIPNAGGLGLFNRAV